MLSIRGGRLILSNVSLLGLHSKCHWHRGFVQFMLFPCVRPGAVTVGYCQVACSVIMLMALRGIVTLVRYQPIRGQEYHLWTNESTAKCHHYWHPNPTFPGPPLIPLASLVQFTVLRKFDLFIFKMSTLFLAFFLMQSQN